MKKSSIMAGVLMFSAPFLVIACVYGDLPAELPILRIPMAGIVMKAPKSIFAAFRVPLMNLTHGLMAAVMLSRWRDFGDERRRSSYLAIFSVLLFSIALKSDFEALEMSGLAGPFAVWATGGTVASVAGGLILAVIRGREVPMPWTELRLALREKALLAGLLAAYLAIVGASLLISHRA